jgi:hypothetical protein
VPCWTAGSASTSAAGYTAAQGKVARLAATVRQSGRAR